MPMLGAMLAAVQATILFADLAGYTALTEAHGDEDAADLAARFYDLVRAELRADARLVKTIGDAVMVHGESPSAVMSVAIRIGRAIDAEPRFPTIRAGLHAGPVIQRGSDVFGATVNMAARVVGHARSGEILCTRAVATDLTGVTGIELQCRGSERFKNVVEPVELFEVVLHERRAKSKAVLDPVCRMRLDPETSAARLEFGERTIYFCSTDCAAAFTRAPQSYPAA
jgi:adenylate cyclase